MSFNQMQDAYQKTLKQSQAYKMAAQKKAYSNQMKQAKQNLEMESVDQSNAFPKQNNPATNTQVYSPPKIESSSTSFISQNQTDLQISSKVNASASVVVPASKQAVEDQKAVQQVPNHLDVNSKQHAGSQTNIYKQSQIKLQTNKANPLPKTKPVMGSDPHSAKV